jgi:hypothetical protein
MSVDLERVVRDAVVQAMREGGWGNGHRTPVALLEPETPMHRHGRHSGSDFCTHCGGCMEPAVYERDRRAAPRTLQAILDRLDRFTELTWKAEPQEVRRLRQLIRPPMGRLPGVLYANFNLFWLGENVQTIRDQARARTVPVEHLNAMLAGACNRSAVRLSKWHLLDMVVLLTDVIGFLETPGCRDHDELKRLTEHLLLAVDRVQSWVDRMIPWHAMDTSLELVP